MRSFDVADGEAPPALARLRDDVATYASGFPYGFAWSDYAAATRLHEDLAELIESIGELEDSCRTYLRS